MSRPVYSGRCHGHHAWPRKRRTGLRSSSFSVSSMLPFAQEKRRKINLGGATSVSSQTDILHSAKARRSAREEIRRRHESALCIQSRWRSFQQSRVVKHILSELFQEDVLGLNGMRALVLIGNNDKLLAQWSEGVVRAGDGKPSTSVSISCVPHCLRLTELSSSSRNFLPNSRFCLAISNPRSNYIPFIRLTVPPLACRLVVTICQRA